MSDVRVTMYAAVARIFGSKFSGARKDAVDQIAVAANTVLLQYFNVPPNDLNRLVKVLKREPA